MRIVEKGGIEFLDLNDFKNSKEISDYIKAHKNGDIEYKFKESMKILDKLLFR